MASYSRIGNISAARIKVLDCDGVGAAVTGIIGTTENADSLWEVYIDRTVNDLPAAAAPTLTAETTGGVIPASTLASVRITAVDAAGEESPPSDAVNTVTTGAGTATNRIKVVLPSVPAGAVSFNIYANTRQGMEALLLTGVTGTQYLTDVSAQTIDAIPSSPTLCFHNLKKTPTVIALGLGIPMNNRAKVFVTPSASSNFALSFVTSA